MIHRSKGARRINLLPSFTTLLILSLLGLIALAWQPFSNSRSPHPSSRLFDPTPRPTLDLTAPDPGLTVFVNDRSDDDNPRLTWRSDRLHRRQPKGRLRPPRPRRPSHI